MYNTQSELAQRLDLGLFWLMFRKYHHLHIFRHAGFAASIFAALVAVSPACAGKPSDDANTVVITDGMRDAFSRGCGDNNGVDRCAASNQQQMRASYGWDSASELIDNGTRFRRFTIIDGHGRELLGVRFERPTGASPRVTVDVPRDQEPFLPEGYIDAPLTASLSEDAWHQTITLTKLFDQKLAGEADSGSLQLCLHAWMTVIEAGDPPSLDRNTSPASKQPAELRSATEGACANGLAFEASSQLANLAFKSLPECQSFDPGQFRNMFLLLATCRKLGGDRLSAAQARDFLEELRISLIDRGDNLLLERFFIMDPESKVIELENALRGNNVYFGSPRALGPDEAYVEGTVMIFSDDFNQLAQMRELTIELRQEFGEFRIADFKLGTIKPSE